MTAPSTRRWWALLAILLSVLVVNMDGTILSVAIPTLATALHADESQLQWFSSGYFLVLALSVLPAGRVGDRFGRRRLLVAAVALFGLGSVACALSTTPTEFLIARLVLGLAGGPITVMAMAAITVLFAEPERPKAVGLFAAANFLALPLGPILGGWMLSSFWWGWVFLINAPVALIGCLAASILLPESRSSRALSFDVGGIAVSSIGLFALTYGLIRAGVEGWDDTAALLLIAAGIVVFAAFVFAERALARRGGDPLLDMTLLRDAVFFWGAILSSVAALTMIGVLFVMPQFFQGVQHATAIESGLRLLPMIGGLIIGALGAAGLARLVGWKWTVCAGFLVTGAGVLLGASTTVRSGMAPIAGWMTVYGLGLGLTTATASSAALSRLSADEGGAGSAVMQLVQKIAAPLGSAILGSVVSAVYISKLDLSSIPSELQAKIHSSVFAGAEVANKLGNPALLAHVESAFTSGLVACLFVCAAAAAAGGILGIMFLPSRTAGSATPRQEETPEDVQV